MPYAQLHIREISAQNLPAYATTLFKRRLRLRNIKCKTILQRRKQPIILTSTSTSMRQAGDDGVYIMKDGSPVNASTNDDVVMISAVEEGTLNPVFRMLDPRPAQEASMVLTTTSSSSATEGAADEVAERGTSEASGGGKKRSLNFLLGPAPSLFTYNLELHDIFHSRLRIEFWDTNTEELLSFTVLKMRDIFEMDFGLHEFSESKELQESDIVIENEPKKESSLCSMSCFICFKWMSNLQVLSMTASQGSSPLPSPSAQGKTYQYENGAMKEGAKFGSLRLTARIDCSDFVIDLLKQPEINLVTVGFQIFLRIIQFSDPMELSRIPRPDVDVDSQGSPSSLCRVLQFDCLRALFDAPARFKSESLSMYRQLVLRLWAVLDAGAARLGLIFTKMLNPFGGHLSVMTDLEVVAPNIVLSTAELMSRLDPGPRFDALSADNLAAVTNLLKLIDPDSSKSVVVAETMTFRALQLLTTFAVQPDLPFSWRLRYLKHLTDNNVEKILAHHLLSYQDSDLGVDALDLCMALTSLVDEIVDTHMAVMPSAALKRTMSFVAEQDSESHKTRRLHIRQSLSAIAPTAVQEVTMPSMHSSKTSVSASLSQAKPVDTSSIDFILEENSDTAKVTTESGPTYSSPSSMVLSPNQRKQQLIKVNSEENILASEKRPRSNATWTIVGSQKPTDEKTREVLKTMEARSLANGSENARLIQRILFSEEFGLERLPMRLVSCKDAGGPTGMGSLLYPMTNMLEERGPPAKTANKHKANVHCLMEAGESFCLTHVVVAVGDLQCRQKNDVSSIAVFVSEQPITDLPPLSYQQLRAVSGYLNEQCPKLPQTDPPARSPIFVADMRPHRFVEIILPKPVHGRYVTLTMNPTSPADIVGDAPGHISIDHVAFIGWTVSNENNRAKPRRPHLELIGNVAYHVGITVPLDGGDIIQLAP